MRLKFLTRSTRRAADDRLELNDVVFGQDSKGDIAVINSLRIINSFISAISIDQTLH